MKWVIKNPRFNVIKIDLLLHLLVFFLDSVKLAIIIRVS